MKKVLFFTMFAVSAMLTASSCMVTGCGNLSDERRLPLASHILKLQGDFSQVENNTVVDVEFTQSDELSAELICPTEVLDYVMFSIHDDLLSIKLSDELSESERNAVSRDLRHSKLILTNPHLNNVRVNGSSTFQVINDLQAANLTATIFGSGDIIFNGVNVGDSKINAQVTGSGDIVFYNETKAKTASFQLNGSGDINCKVLSTHSVSVNINGSGDVNIPVLTTQSAMFDLHGSGDLVALKINANTVNATLVGSGDMKLEGECGTAELSLNGSGDIVARNLVAQDVTASVISSGDLSCHAVNKLTANVTGSGDIRYKGNPDITYLSKRDNINPF